MVASTPSSVPASTNLQALSEPLVLDRRLVLVPVPLSLIGVNSAGTDHAAGPLLGSVYHVPVSRGSELYSATAADEGPDGGVWSLAGPRLSKDSLFVFLRFFFF